MKAAEKVRKQQRRLEIQSVKNYRKNIIEIEEKQKKQQEDANNKAKQNFKSFI